MPLIRRTSNLLCELLRDSASLDPGVEVVDRANGSDETRLASEASEFAEAVDAFDAGAVRAEDASGLVFL